MKIKLTLACALLLGCAPNPEAARREKLVQLEAARREVVADLFRQKAECQAFAIEFPGNQPGIDDCLAVMARMQDLAAITIADIDRRASEIAAER